MTECEVGDDGVWSSGGERENVLLGRDFEEDVFYGFTIWFLGYRF